jgi:peptide/nickel transport system substrate-binding protein
MTSGSRKIEATRSAPLTRRSILALAAAAAAPARAAEGDVLRMAFNVPIGTLDPAKFRVGGLENNYVCYVFNRLTTNDARLAVQPDLATRWEASADLKSWTFQLREGVRFHDGKPLDAEDVVYTYRRLGDAATGSPLRAQLGFVQGVEAAGPLTVRFTLSIPYADMPALVGRYEAAIIAKGGADGLASHPVGTGPFRFVSYQPGDQMILERNTDYFEPGVPKVGRVVIRIMPEFTTAVAALQNGEIDVVFDLPPEQVEKLKRSRSARVEEATGGFWLGFVMNAGMKPFDDPRVREAFIKIIDKPSFTDIATFGEGLATVTPIPPTSPVYRNDIPLTSDIAGAKALLAQAGYGGGTAIELIVPGNSPPMERLGVAFRDAAKQAGVSVSLRVVPQDKFIGELEGKVPFNVDQFLGAVTPDLAVWDFYNSRGAWNGSLWHYRNEEVDQVLDEARATVHPAEQKRLYGRFQEIVAKDGPGSVVFIQPLACGVGARVKDFRVVPLQLADISRATLSA